MSPEEGAPGRWVLLWHRYKALVAALSFGAGLASFLLVERQEMMAQAMVILLPLSWLVLLAEPALARLAPRWPRLRLSPPVLRFLLQGLHQESLFFTLPFFLATTTWASGQAVFTSLLLLAALGSIVDPFYYGPLARRRWAYLAFHALAVFATVLTAGPMLWLLTTDQTMALAAGCMALVSMPSLAHVLRGQRLHHVLALALVAVALAVLAWLLRAWIPPATLWVRGASMTQSVDVALKAPGPAYNAFTVAQAGQGLYAWTPIRAPRGLHEQVEHVWMHEGDEVDRVALDITGGRAEGYRAWSVKRAFPADPRGRWQVRVVTEGGQLIGVLRFQII